MVESRDEIHSNINYLNQFINVNENDDKIEVVNDIDEYSHKNTNVEILNAINNINSNIHINGDKFDHINNKNSNKK